MLALAMELLHHALLQQYAGSLDLLFLSGAILPGWPGVSLHRPPEKKLREGDPGAAPPPSESKTGRGPASRWIEPVAAAGGERRAVGGRERADGAVW